MRPAPPVALTIPRCLPWVLLQVTLAAAAAGAATAALLLQAGLPALGVGAVCALAIGAAAAVAWRHPLDDRGGLRWDGHQWWFRPEGAADELPGRLHPAIDLGDALLLRFDAGSRPDGGARTARRGRRPVAWLPVARLAPAESSALRAAVYSRRLKTDHPAHRMRDPE